MNRSSWQPKHDDCPSCGKQLRHPTAIALYNGQECTTVETSTFVRCEEEGKYFSRRPGMSWQETEPPPQVAM
jgi:hypothetical protein